MLKTLVSAIIASSLIATPTFAASFLDKLPLVPTKKAVHVTKKMHGKKTAKSKHFTDFSGNWAGTCTDSHGESEAVTGFQIFNDEFYLLLNSQLYGIGDISGTSTANAEGVLYGYNKILWSADRTSLEWHSSWTGSDHDEDAALGTAFGKMTLSLNDKEELIFAGAFSGLTMDAMENIETDTFNCVLHKE